MHHTCHLPSWFLIWLSEWEKFLSIFLYTVNAYCRLGTLHSAEQCLCSWIWFATKLGQNQSLLFFVKWLKIAWHQVWVWLVTKGLHPKAFACSDVTRECCLNEIPNCIDEMRDWWEPEWLFLELLSHSKIHNNNFLCTSHGMVVRFSRYLSWRMVSPSMIVFFL